MSHVLINIDVNDLAAATKFYVAAFDLKIGRIFDDDAIELLGFPSPIYLLNKSDAAPPFPESSMQRNFQRHWTPVHLDIVVDDIEIAFAKAIAAGAKAESGIGEPPWGRIALMSDPFGHGFCLLQFKGRGYDEIVRSS